MIWSRLFGLALVTSLATAGTYHHPHDRNGHKTSSVRVLANNYILQFESHLAHTQAHEFLRASNIQYEVRHDYTVIFHGTAIRLLSDHDGRMLAQIPGVKNVWPTTIHTHSGIISSAASSTTSAGSATAHTQGRERRALPPQDGNPKNTPYTLHHMTGVNVLQDQYKLTGKGIKVAILDTGIDYKHPAFALPGATEGCFGISPDGTPCRVAYGYDFIGDDSSDQSSTHEDADPMDCNGHGTHVAGIVGAYLQPGIEPRPPQPFVGVAPEVTFGAYRVLGCTGEGDDAGILAGLHRAVEDKMDIINLSLGSGPAFKTNPFTIAVDDAALKGSLVVASAGNQGADGVWMVTDTGLGDNTMSAASFSNVYSYYPSFIFAGKKYPYLCSEFPNTPLHFQGSTYLYPLVDDKGKLTSGCNEVAYKGLKGQKGANLIVVSSNDQSNCTLAQIEALAASRGAAAIFFPTPLGQDNIEYPEGLPSNFSLPLGKIRMSSIKEIMDNNKLSTIIKTPISWNAEEEPFLAAESGAPSVFSSLGLDGDLRSKPDLGAPGGKILSPWLLEKGGYITISGTSMASPYIAGSYALYIQNKNYTKISSVNIRKIFKNTAAIYARPGSQSMAVSAAKQGSGLINALRAVTTTTTITPDHIDLLDSANFRSKVTIVLTNSGPSAESYKLSHLPAETLNSYPKGNTFPLGAPLIERYTAKVSFSGSSLVQVGPGQSVNIELTFEEPAGANPAQFPLYSGFIIATPKTDPNGVVVHVPYTGMLGLAAQVPIFDTDAKYPRLSSISPKDYAENKLQIDANGHAVFDGKKNLPSVVLRLGSHSPMVRVDVYSLNDTIKPLGILKGSDGPALGQMGRNPNLNVNWKADVTNYTWTGEIYVVDATTDLNLLANNETLIQPTQLEAGSYRVVASAQRKMTLGRSKEDYEVHDLGVVTFL